MIILLLLGALVRRGLVLLRVFLREERVAAPAELVERARGRGREAADLEGGDHRFPRLSGVAATALGGVGRVGGPRAASVAVFRWAAVSVLFVAQAARSVRILLSTVV